jgi:hypothetical protein
MVATRIYNQSAPKEVFNAIGGTYTASLLPFIVINQVGSSETPIDDCNIRDYYYGIECYATNTTDAIKLGTYVRHNLERGKAKLTTDANVAIIAGRIIGEMITPYFEETIFSYTVDVRITFKETLTW